MVQLSSLRRFSLSVRRVHTPTTRTVKLTASLHLKMDGWKVVSTCLKNISQNWNLPQIEVKIKNI